MDQRPELSGRPHYYVLYGCNWETDLQFRSFMLPGTRPSQAHLQRTATVAPPSSACRYASNRPQNGKPLLRIYGKDDELLLSFPRVADFLVTRDRIDYSPARGSDDSLIELLFLGPVAALWLELNGIIALHASAIVVNDCAIVFLQQSGGGKSTLAASFLSRQQALVSDDVLAVSVTPGVVQGIPGYPQLRLAPEIARRFGNDIDALPQVHPLVDKKRIAIGKPGFGSFCRSPRPISRIYVPQRAVNGDIPVTAHALSPSQSMRELVRSSFIANAAEALSWQSQRVRKLALIAESVPVKRLTYSSGLRYLDAVCDAVLHDLNATH